MPSAPGPGLPGRAAGIVLAGGPGQGQPGTQRQRDGGDHQVEHARTRQQLDADDRSGDDAGHGPGDEHQDQAATGAPGASWHSNAHDAISGLLYASLVAAQLALAGRFGRDPAWRHWRPPLLASAAATGAILIAYATDVTGPEAAILQRAAVTLPQAAVAAIAARLLWRGPGQAGSGG
jgi:hypothetical protein